MNPVLDAALLPPPPDARELTATSLRALNDALPELYATTDRTQLPRVFTDVLARLVPGDSHGVVVHDRAQGRRYWHLRPATAEHEKLIPVFFANFHEFTPAEHRRRTGTGEALALSDFIGAQEAGSRAIYTDYYHRLGLEDDLSINVQRGEVVTCAAVLRARRGFRRDERALLNALRPHLQQAWATAEMITALTAARTTAAVSATEWSPERLEVRYGLTPREAEVLVWVAQGKTNPEIAGILRISPHTVRTHLERTFAKLGVETRHAAGLRAIEVLGLPQ
jgi:DNA-binding CsgD family transcriptional regulator